MKTTIKFLLAAITVALMAACGGGSTPVAVTPTPVTCTAPAVLTNGVCVTPAPTVSVQLTKSKTSVGSPVTLSWSSTNATSCVGMDALSGTKAINNSEVITPSKGGQYTYTISCDGAGGTAKQSVPLVVPMQLYKSSYENKMAAGKVLGPQPVPPAISFVVAYGDFFGDGSYSMLGNDATPYPNPSILSLWKLVNGVWVDRTIEILKDKTGCVALKKGLVADFNGDGNPDIFLGCHGYDSPPFPGEQQRVLLSQPDGTYKNVLLPFSAYAHGASAADVNGNGYSDVVLSDTSIRLTPFYLVNNKDGTFTEDKTRMPQSLKSKGVYSLELIDTKGTNKFDLWVGGVAYFGTNPFGSIAPTFFYNDGGNSFSDTNKLAMPTVMENVTPLDVIFDKNKIYFLYVQDQYTGVQIEKYDLTTGVVSVLYTHTGPYSATLASMFNLMIEYNGNIMPMDYAYKVSVSIQ